MIQPIKSGDHFPQPAETFFAPATTETAFWRPRFIVNAPIMQHVSFLFWLVGAVRPRNIAVCGSGNGAALFSLCQAMDKLNISGRCLGIGFWTDGETGEAGTVPAPLRDHASQLYDDLVYWRCDASVREALLGIAPGSLDLLFIDACDLPKGELPSAEEWLRTLHKDGVIIVHGELTFGNGWAELLSALAGKQSIISLPDEQGLVVLSKSIDQQARLCALLEVSDQGVLPGEIGLFFRRIGQGHLAVAQQIEASEKGRKLTSSLSAMRRERDELLNTERELREAYEARSRKLSELQAELFDCEARVAEFETQLEAAQQEASRLAAELQSEGEARSVENTALTAQLEDIRQQYEKTLADIRASSEAAAQAQLTNLEQELYKARQETDGAKAELERERSTRFSETTALTARLEALRHTSQELEASSVTQVQQEIQRLKVENVALLQRVNDLMNSTSWRVTAPMRKLKSTFSRK